MGRDEAKKFLDKLIGIVKSPDKNAEILLPKIFDFERQLKEELRVDIQRGIRAKETLDEITKERE